MCNNMAKQRRKTQREQVEQRKGKIWADFGSDSSGDEEECDDSDAQMFDPKVSRIYHTEHGTSDFLYNIDKHQKKFVPCAVTLSGNNNENVFDKLWEIARYMTEMRVSNTEIHRQYTVRYKSKLLKNPLKTRFENAMRSAESANSANVPDTWPKLIQMLMSIWDWKVQAVKNAKAMREINMKQSQTCAQFYIEYMNHYYVYKVEGVDKG